MNPIKNDKTNNYPLPMSKEEMKHLGYDECDFILISGDAYIDHPSFGTAVIGRAVEQSEYTVGIIAQPQSIEDVMALGMPRLAFGITAGAIDSNLARTTIMGRPRSEDAFSPDGQADLRPKNATLIYTNYVKNAFKGSYIIIGGLEASLRRFPYYDYWSDKVKRSILFDSKADILVYGNGEKAMVEILNALDKGETPRNIKGTAEILKELPTDEKYILLPSAEEIIERKNKYLEMSQAVHTNMDKSFISPCQNRFLHVNKPAKITPEELDDIYSLPFTRKPHPMYEGKKLTAFDMIKESVTTHRGCYGGCNFCAISAHQGKTVVSRTPRNICKEVEQIIKMPYFRGTITDLGGPTANMYGTYCKKRDSKCKRLSCLFPKICANLETDHLPSLRLLRDVSKLKGVKHLFIQSGIRTDLATVSNAKNYIDELAKRHTGGRLKIAPEHTEDSVLTLMGKPSNATYRKFINEFFAASKKAGKRQAIVEYFISGHPGCTMDDMLNLRKCLKEYGVEPSQVQDFYPAPLTISADMYYLERNPLTGESIYVAKTEKAKAEQRAILLSHLPKFDKKAKQIIKKNDKNTKDKNSEKDDNDKTGKKPYRHYKKR